MCGTASTATPEAIAARIVAVRRRFPHFGPKKIKAWLEREKPREPWPAVSTIGDILKRAGLVEARSKRRRAVAQGEIVAPATEPNQEWSIDFKGWFRTSNGERCDPLTLSDAASRYVVDIAIVEPTWAGVRGALQRVFEDFGLPEAIRSDNGSPFGSTGAGGLSALSVWRPSPRPLPMRLDDPWYDADHEVRRVKPQGVIKWRGEQVFVGEALAGELVGLAENDNGSRIVRFASRDLGAIDRDGRFLRFAPEPADDTTRTAR